MNYEIRLIEGYGSMVPLEAIEAVEEQVRTLTQGAAVARHHIEAHANAGCQYCRALAEPPPPKHSPTCGQDYCWEVTRLTSTKCTCGMGAEPPRRPMCVNCGRFDTPCYLNTKETSGDPNWPGSPCTFDPRLPEGAEPQPQETQCSHRYSESATGRCFQCGKETYEPR